MFPDNEISDPARVAGFNFPVKTLSSADKLQDWERGGIALNDTSQGLDFQLWHYTLEIDKVTGNGSVYVEAPTVAKTLMFDGLNIAEIAGAFDQNMNPFVAYQQGGSAKIWWYDPTLSSMTHTTLTAGSIDLRCTLDDKRAFNVSDSDIVLSYVRGGALYFRLQRERYAIEHLLFNDGSVERLVSLAMNSQWRLQWRLRGQSESAVAGAYSEPFLGDVVYELNRDAGLKPEQIMVADLYRETDIVPGLKIAIEQGVTKPIESLMEIYQFTKSQHGKQLVYEHKGKGNTFRIPYKHLVVTGNKQAFLPTKVDPLKLPKKVNINHIDSTGGFAKNKQTATRRSNLITNKEELTIDTQVVLTPDQAATAALTIIKAKHGELFDYEFSTTIRYTEIVPGDEGEVEDEVGTWHPVRIEEKNEDNNVIDWKAKFNAGELTYGNSSTPGKYLDPPISTTPGLVGDTIVDLFNVPIQRETHDELGLYVAARGASSGWGGYDMYFSADEGASYSVGYSSEVPSNIGETATSVTDASTSVEVLMPYSLESISPAQIASGYNRAFMGDEEVQYQTATFLGMVDGMYHYNLTGMVRGILHTDAEPWAAGIRFVAYDESVLFVQIERQYIGQDLYYKAVSKGQSLDEVDPMVYLFDPAVNQTEWAVTNVVVEEAVGGGLKVSWDGSPRIGTFGTAPFHSKYMVGYQVKFANGHIIETTAEEVTYPEGLLGTVVEVRARNSITGLGPLADGSGAVDPGDISVFGFSGSFPDMYEGQSVFMWDGDNGISMTGGLLEAYARGFVVPGVGAKAPGYGAKLDQTTFCGIPFAAGTYTSLVQLQGTSPDPLGTGMSNINQSVTVLPTPSHGLLDLEFREYQMHKTTLVNTTPPWKKFQINGGGASLWFPGVTTGKVVAQFIISGAAALSVLLGINNMHGDLYLGGPTNAGLGEFADCAVLVGDGTYSMELDADTGDWWLYKDGTGLVDSGNVAITGDHQYRIAMSNPNDQVFTVEFNGGNEAWFMAVTQAGHGGIPVPARDIPLAWAYCEPDYILSFNGNGEEGATYADAYAGGPSSLVKGNAEFSTGRHRFSVEGAYSSGICVAAFDITDGVLGSPGSPNSAGVDNNTLRWSWGGGGSAALAPLNGTYVHPILALDADGNTLKVAYKDHYGTPVVVYTLPIPAGETWQVGAWVTVGTYIKGKQPGPAGYADAIVQ